MISDDRSREFQRHLAVESINLDGVARAVTCCGGDIILIYQSLTSSAAVEWSYPRVRDEAVLFSIQTTEPGCESVGGVVVHDLQIGPFQWFGGAGDWVHLIVPSRFFGNFKGSSAWATVLGSKRLTITRDIDLETLAKTLVPYLRHERRAEHCFVDSVVRACLQLLILRLSAHGPSDRNENERWIAPKHFATMEGTGKF